ncbi:MAG TPA: acetyl-CoA C-acetyltransferase, partial [Marinobacter adhaerens]|nr:acetyl-CoA C-acetyltransferase [Marinobacter adhaerens]
PGQAPQDHMFLDGLEDAETGRLMGAFAQEMADKKGYTREEMDEYAITSLTRAKKAIEEGLLKDEIIPVTVKSRKGEVIVEDDEQPHNANIDKIPTLRPAFAKDGTVTAA